MTDIDYRDEELTALREEVAVLRDVQARALNGDRHEAAADTRELLDGELARIGAHLRICSGSSALPPRAQTFYRQLADSIGSVLQMRRGDMRDLQRELRLGNSWGYAVAELLDGDLQPEEGQET